MVLRRRRRAVWATGMVCLQSLVFLSLAAIGLDDDEWARHRPPSPAPKMRPGGGTDLRVDLLDGFRLSQSGETVHIPKGSRQLLAFLALRRGPVDRPLVAATFWPDVTERRAYGALRAALSRLDPVSRRALQVGPVDLSLADDVVVDIRAAHAFAHHLLDPDTASLEPRVTARAVALLSSDLLPSWYDDWVVVEAEQWRQLRLHALDVLAKRLTGAGRFAEAAASASAAARADPLRESTETALIRVHLAEGNRAEAIREYERFRVLLKVELGVEPSPQLRALLTAQ